MKVRSWTNEHLVYLLAFAMAVILRLLQLGRWPLSGAESVWALQSLEIARGTATVVGSEPGQVILTGMLFWLFGDSNFLARFLPALTGSLLVIGPYFFRRELGKRAAIVLAFGLALDPGLVAISRQAGGPMLAAGLLVLAMAAWYARRPILAGIFGGLALLGGSALWQGVLTLGTGWLLYLWANRSESRAVAYDSGIPRFLLPTVLLAAGITVVLGGTLFFRAPGGLSGVGSSLSSYLSGWQAGETLRPYQWLLLLVLYEILPLILGLAATIRGWLRNLAVERFLSLVTLSALVIGLLYPARSAQSLVWVLIPLWGLAAREAVRLLVPIQQDRYAHAAHTILTLCIFLFIAANLAALMNEIGFRDDTVTVRVAILLGAGVLLLVTSVLVSFGWSTATSLSGLVKGSLAVLLLYTVAVSTGGAGLRLIQTPELWMDNPSSAQLDLLANTADDLSEWRTGRAGSIDLVVVNADNPALRWAFRNFKQASFVSAMDPHSTPALVITPVDQEPGLASSYRGQDFLIAQNPQWQNLQSLDWMNWLVFRRMTQQPVSVILWARNDLFPDVSLTSGENIPPE